MQRFAYDLFGRYETKGILLTAYLTSFQHDLAHRLRSGEMTQRDTAKETRCSHFEIDVMLR